MASTIQVDNIKDIGGNTIISSNGSGTFTSNLPASAPNVSTATGTLPIANGGTGGTSFSAAGLANTPSWYVRNGTTTNNISSGTYHTLVFDTEDWDTNSAFASNAFTCPSGQAGKYLLNANLVLTGLNADKRWDTYFAKGGSRLNKCYYYSVAVGNNEDMTNNMSCIVDISVGDVLTCQGYHNHGSDRSFDGSYSYFAGYRLIGV